MYDNEDDYSSSGEGKYMRYRNMDTYNTHDNYQRYDSDSRKKRKFSGNKSPGMIYTSKSELGALLDEKLQPLQQKMTSLEKTFSAKRVTMLEDKVKSLELENKILKDKFNQMDTFNRRSNLRFYGIKEESGENCEKVLLNLIVDVFPTFNERTFERAHRLGPNLPSEPRPILTKFFHFKDKMSVLSKRDDLLELGIRVGDDFNKEVEANRRPLLPYVKEARKQGLQPKLIGDKLILNGQRYSKNELHKLPDPIKPEKVSTKTENGITAFFTKDSPLSNFYPCKFKVGSLTYNCGEQFLTVAKAKMFEDDATAEQLLKLKSPHEQKKVGYTVKKYSHARWIEESEKKVTEGIFEKFSQSSFLKNFLLDTGDNHIVEASRDKIWGIGLTLNDPKIWDRENHDGENRLGNILMNVRDMLKK